MKALMLYGANCTLDVWSDFKRELDHAPYLGTMDYASYPHKVTSTAKDVSDVTRWVHEEYGRSEYDTVIGHSMGGIVALELATRWKWPCKKVILIESNLKPAKEFYRNLMMPDNMERHGKRVMDMLREEAAYYNPELMASLQEDFDYTPYVRQCSAVISGIYGDRGVANYANRIADFCLEDEVAERIHFYFVEKSCHMPMIENPKGLVTALSERSSCQGSLKTNGTE